MIYEKERYLTSLIPSTQTMSERYIRCTIVETYFHSLTRLGLGRGYYLKPSKIVLIVHPENLEAGKLFERIAG